MTVHSLPVATLDERRRTRLGRVKMLLLLAVCAAPVVASYFSYYVIRPGARSNYGELISPTRPLPAGLRLADPDGRRVDAAALRGQWLLVVVSRPDCDSACEQRLLLQRQLRETLGRDKDRLDKLWLIAGDGPLRSAAVDAVLRSQGSGNAGPLPSSPDPLGGSDATRQVRGHSEGAFVLRVARDELSRWLQAAPGRELDDHLYLVDPLGQWMMRMPPEPEPARLKRDVDRLLRASASWDRPGR